MQVNKEAMEESYNFYFLVQICGGLVEAYRVCEQYGGIKLTIPKKEHKRVVVKELILRNVSESEILKHIPISKTTLYNIKKELEC
ncbi:hypothetical protein [Helicobacter sp.]|uniref:hypothetical protein n=1 Tax=Helicobacter sp. TaxID=218 RepID=UPI002A765303|nr:hypothetical protein [Helicobacter sp.]MDY2585005.1 hypothetical protein [Helicobacter sp.]